MQFGRWTEAVSREMRAEGDFAADRCLEELEVESRVPATAQVFAHMPRNNSPIPDDAPAPLHRFFASEMSLPDWMDHKRIIRGEQVFMENGLPIAVVLLCRSIPEGYGAPSLTRILVMTGLLVERPYRRLLAVLQMVLDVAVEGGFEPNGKALRVAMKLRLLHAGLRRMAAKKLPTFEAEQAGIPCNHEDMLATLLAFSLLVVEGLRALGEQLTDQEAEDFFYPWRVMAYCMGIPERFIPTDLRDAKQFYAAYAARQYVPANQNPDGVILATANTAMLKDLLPPLAKRLGLSTLPEYYMWRLMGKEACERVRIPPPDRSLGLRLTAGFLVHVTANNESTLLERAYAPISRFVSKALFTILIRREYHGEPKIIVPQTVADLWRI